MKLEPSSNDLELMLKFCKGDDNAFSVLMEQNLNRVFHTIQRFVNNPHDAEDLAQEVFLRIYNARSRYVPTAQFHTWLYRIITNLCLNYIRDCKRHYMQSIQLKDSSSFALQIEDEAQETPSRILVRQETSRQVRQALQELPPNQRIAVILCKYEGLSYQEIATTMDTSVQAIKSLLNRAKNNLKQRLQENIMGQSDIIKS